MKESKKMTLFGKEVNVVNWIPYEKKVEAAKEYVALAYSFYEDVGVVCLGYMASAAYWMVMLKYYTDMDVSEYSTEEGLYALMDMADEHHGDAGDLDEFCGMDATAVFHDLAVKIAEATKEVYEKEHSLGYRILKSFGFLFDGEDIAKTLAESREVSEQMVDHLGAIAKAKDVLEANAKDTVDLSEFAKRKKD